MAKISKEKVGKIAGFALRVISGGLLTMLLPSININIAEKNEGSDCEGYIVAFNAIMKSDMLDSNKEEAAKLLKRNRDIGYYKAFIDVVESDMLDSTKMDMLKHLNK